MDDTTKKITSTLKKKNEIVWVHYVDKDGVTKFVIASKPARETYNIYSVSDDGNTIKKLGTGKNPSALEEKFKCLQKK